MMISILLNTANLNAVNISSPEFLVWQHLEDHWNKTQLHKLVDVPIVPVSHLYKHIINNSRPFLPFDLADESIEDTGSIWTLFSHTGINIMAIGLLIPAGTRDILLLLFLVLTCHLSTPTFSIRFFATYYGG